MALVLLLLVAAFFYINSSAGQQRLLKFATDLLQEKLETKVQIDSVSVNFGTMDVNLFGLDVEDRQQRPMLQTDRISVSVDLKDLMAHKVEVKSADIDGLRAKVFQPRDSAARRASCPLISPSMGLSCSVSSVLKALSTSFTRRWSLFSTRLYESGICP